MSDNILNEYLVKLSFTPDASSYRRFEATMADAAGIVSRHTSKIVKDVFGFQSAIVGGFAAIGGATLGLAQKVADADLGYQLFATRMYMSVGAAKSLKIATDALGYSLDEIAWNPELLRRFETLEVLQSKLSKQMDPDFEKNLRGIRDLGFEFTKLRVEGEYIASNVVSQLFKGLHGEDALAKLQHLNTWIAENLPEITRFFTQHLIPIFKDGEAVIGGTVSVLKDLALTFTNLVGAFSGDTSIESSAFSMQKFAAAIDHVANGLAGLGSWISSAEKMILDPVNLFTHLTMRRRDLLIGDAQRGLNDSSPGGAAALAVSALLGYGALELALYAKRGLLAVLHGLAGRGVVATAGVEATAGAEATAAAEVTAAAAGGLGMRFIPIVGTGLAIGTAVSLWDASNNAIHFRRSLGFSENPEENRHRIWQLLRGQKLDPIGSGKYAAASGEALTHEQTVSLITSMASQYGINPAYAHAIATEESGENQLDASGRLKLSKLTRMGYAKGVFQLEDSTAAQLGVNSTDASQNIKGGVNYLTQLLTRYGGNFEAAAAAYNWGSKNVDALIKSHGQFSTAYLPRDVQDYVAKADRNLEAQGVHIGSVTIHIDQPGATHEQILDATSKGIYDAAQRERRSNIATMKGPYQ